jgi:protein gp37
VSAISTIEWTDSTFNPFIGCTKVSPGCDHCYAEQLMDRRLGRVRWGAGQARVRTSAAYWRQPERWDKADFRACGFCGWRGEIDTLVDDGCPSCRRHEKLNPARRRVFCASLADVFDNEAPEAWRADLLNLIADTPNLDWLVLTKRVGNAQRMLDEYVASDGHPSEKWDRGWPNLWLGVTVCTQQEADRDIPKLLATPAAVRFVSCEPLLGDIRLGSYLQRSPSAAFAAGRVTEDMPAWTRIGSTAIDWVIAGGEYGPGARPMHPDWARSLRDQCQAARVPYFFKQWGEWLPMLGHAHGVRVGEKITLRDGTVMGYAGKRAAGRLLDGRQWSQFPRVVA